MSSLFLILHSVPSLAAFYLPPSAANKQTLHIKLAQLQLWTNSLTGTLPSSMGSLTQLQQLDISGNFLWGTIPHEFGRLSRLGM